MLQRSLTSALDHGTVCQRITEGNTELDDRGPGCDRSEDDLTRGSEVRVARGDVGNQGRFPLEVEGHSGMVDFRFQILDCPVIHEKGTNQKSSFDLQILPEDSDIFIASTRDIDQDYV